MPHLTPDQWEYNHQDEERLMRCAAWLIPAAVLITVAVVWVLESLWKGE